MIHADSKQLNLVDQKSLYVGISRATHGAYIYTDDKSKLIDQVKRNSGEKSNAMDKERFVDSIGSISKESPSNNMPKQVNRERSIPSLSR